MAEAEKYKHNQIDAKLTLKATAAAWLREKGWMQEEEYAAFQALEQARSSKHDNGAGAKLPAAAHLEQPRKVEFYVGGVGQGKLFTKA